MLLAQKPVAGPVACGGPSPEVPSVALTTTLNPASNLQVEQPHSRGVPGWLAALRCQTREDIK